MKFPSDFLSTETTTTAKENWLYIQLSGHKGVWIFGQTIGMYTVKAGINQAWKSYLLGFLVNEMRK